MYMQKKTKKKKENVLNLSWNLEWDKVTPRNKPETHMGVDQFHIGFNHVGVPNAVIMLLIGLPYLSLWSLHYYFSLLLFSDKIYCKLKLINIFILYVCVLDLVLINSIKIIIKL